MARTAVVAGTATAVSNRVSRRQASRWGYADEPQQPQQGYQEPAYQQAPPPPPPAAPSTDPVERLNELAHLRNQGLLTDEEFSAAKAKLLA